MRVKYLDNSLSVIEIQAISDEQAYLDIEFIEQKPEIINASLDELVGQIVVFLNTDEVQAVIAAAAIAKGFHAIVKKIYGFAQKKTITRLTSDYQTIQALNVLIQVDNVKILQLCDENISLNEYLSLALQAAIDPNRPNNMEIIISYEGCFRVESLEMFIRRKRGIKNRYKK